MERKIQTILLALIFIISSIGIIIFSKKIEKKEIADSIITTVDYVYTVKEFKGKVAVFKYGESLPFQILDCPVSSLPQTEADIIRIGIDIENEINLQKIIEAYD